MRLVVRLFAVLRERAGCEELVLDELPDDLDVGGLKRELERRHPALGSLQHVRGVIGTRYVQDDTMVEDGADLSLLPPVSGGSGADAADDEALERGVFELCAEALDLSDAHDRVAHPSCGAICTFTGTTRDNNRDRAVVRLEYEVFEAMTGPEMARIFERCRAELVVPDERVRMLCRHRVGVVEVGEPSVAIAVASPHRELAFRVARYLIDELKTSLPIWKKEHYEDGEHWIGERS